VSAWYLLSGSVRLRRCPKVDEILDELRELRGDEFEVRVVDAGRGAIDLTFRGGSEFTDDGADELDGMLRSLGPYVLEAAVFTGEYDGELRVIAIDPAGKNYPTPCSIPVLGIVR
jgi:hypothetical protein